MYWPDHWEKRVSQPRSDGQAPKKSKEGPKPGELLEAVIDRTSTPADAAPRKQKRIKLSFPTAAAESGFKGCLARVPVECRMEQRGKRLILALRPKNLLNFDQLIANSGLGDCEPIMRALKWLRENPDEFLRFERR